MTNTTEHDERRTIAISLPLHAILVTQAQKERRSLRAITELALAEYLDKAAKGKKVKPS